MSLIPQKYLLIYAAKMIDINPKTEINHVNRLGDEIFLLINPGP
jgi:hypothetical protein